MNKSERVDFRLTPDEYTSYKRHGKIHNGITRFIRLSCRKYIKWQILIEQAEKYCEKNNINEKSLKAIFR